MRRNLVDYFKKNLRKGYTEESLKFALMKQGYPRSTVELSLTQAHKEIAETAPILKEKPTIRHELITDDNQQIVLEKNKPTTRHGPGVLCGRVAAVWSE